MEKKRCVESELPPAGSLAVYSRVVVVVVKPGPQPATMHCCYASQSMTCVF